MGSSGIAGVIYESCATDCSGAQHPAIVMDSLLGFPATQEFRTLWLSAHLQTTLQVAGVDCAEEVSLIQRALKPLGGVREVRVNIMSGKAIIVHGASTSMPWPERWKTSLSAPLFERASPQ